MLAITFVEDPSSTTSGSCQLLTATNRTYGLGCLSGWILLKSYKPTTSRKPVPLKRRPCMHGGRDRGGAMHGVPEAKGETLASVLLCYMVFPVFLHS